MTEIIKDELTIDHDIYISVGLKNPMKPSTFKEIIDTLLFENIGYMSSWGTHTKDEYIEIYNEQAIKMKSLITTIESLRKDNAYKSMLVESHCNQIDHEQATMEDLIVQIESQQKERDEAVSDREEALKNFNAIKNEYFENKRLIESQKEEIGRLLAIIAEKEDKLADYFDQEGEK